jgi:hypothetical protein
LPNPFNPTSWASVSKEGSIYLTYTTTSACYYNTINQNNLSNCTTGYTDYGIGTVTNTT